MSSRPRYISDFLAEQSEARVYQAIVIRSYSNGHALVSIDGYWAKLIDSGKSTKIGSEISVRVLSIDEIRDRVYVTKKKIKRQFTDISEKLEINTIYTGVVESVVDYGIFVSVSGYSGLVHISELGWSKDLKDPKRYRPGEDVRVFVEKIDVKGKRMSLSIKRTKPDPYQDLVRRFKADNAEIYYGEIANVVDYGIFVELIPGVEGLLHVSTFLPKNQKIPVELQNKLKVVKNIPVRIAAIDEKRRRASLEYCGSPFNELTAMWWPEEGELFDGNVRKVDEIKAHVEFPNLGTGFLYSSDDHNGFFDISFLYRTGAKLTFRIIGFDFLAKVPRLKLEVTAGDIDLRPFNFILENFLLGKAENDQNRKLKIEHPYFVLASQLLNFSGLRLNKTFDYIYHFGHISSVEEIKFFGLLHRASVEFKLGQPELALSLVTDVLKKAVDQRRGRIVRIAVAILKKNSWRIWE